MDWLHYLSFEALREELLHNAAAKPGAKKGRAASAYWNKRAEVLWLDI